jgi:hypothetical protein
MVLFSQSGDRLRFVMLKRCDYVQFPCLSSLSTDSHSEETTDVLENHDIHQFEVVKNTIFFLHGLVKDTTQFVIQVLTAISGTRLHVFYVTPCSSVDFYHRLEEI